MKHSGRTHQRAAPNARSGRSEFSGRSLLTKVRSYAAESLVKNSVFLILNIGVTTVGGYGSLILLTHLYSKEIVGLSAAVVSTSTLIVSITQSGVNYSLPRFLPTSNHRGALINTVNTAVVAATAIGSVIFLLTPFANKMFALGGFIFCVTFIVTTCLQAGSNVLSTALVADRQSGKMTRANVVPNIIKVGSPPVFRPLGNIGALIARQFYNLASYITFARILRQRGYHLKIELNRESLRDLGRFSLGMSVASAIGGLPLLMLPLVIVSRMGPVQNAYWSIASTIWYLLNSLPSMVTQALLPEISYQPAQRKRLLIRSTYLVAGMVVPALIIMYLAAPILAGLFGGSYSAGMLPALHVLIFSAFITMLNYASGAILFLAKKTTPITIVNIVDAIIVLGLAGTWATDAQGVAISWFVGDVANTVLFWLFAILALREVGFRFEDLGGTEAFSATERERPASMADSVEQSFDILAAIAEQQRLARQRPYLNLTEPRGLYTAIALSEANREWAQQQAADRNAQRAQVHPHGGSRPRRPPDRRIPPSSLHDGSDARYQGDARRSSDIRDDPRYPDHNGWIR